MFLKVICSPRVGAGRLLCKQVNSQRHSSSFGSLKLCMGIGYRYVFESTLWESVSSGYWTAWSIDGRLGWTSACLLLKLLSPLTPLSLLFWEISQSAFPSLGYYGKQIVGLDGKKEGEEREERGGAVPVFSSTVGSHATQDCAHKAEGRLALCHPQAYVVEVFCNTTC